MIALVNEKCAINIDHVESIEYDINNRSGVRVINPINRRMVDYYHRRQKVCFYINGRQKWHYDLSFQSIIKFLRGS